MITIIVIALTSVISFLAFNNENLVNKLIFYPPAVRGWGWYRLFSYGVLHADLSHLFFNMFTLYLFGTPIEQICQLALGETIGSLCYILLYITALFVSIFPTYIKKKDNAFYRGLGASGAVSAVVFAYILIHPMNLMGIMFIPIWMPAFLFGFVFILISIQLDRRQAGRINHSAHITGGLYGIVFMVIAFAALRHLNLIQFFIEQIQIHSINDLIRFGF